MDAMKLHERVTAAREYAKLTQVQLAERVGLAQQTLSRLESGKNRGSSKLTDIAVECGVSPVWLSREQGPMVPGDAPTQPLVEPVGKPDIADLGIAVGVIAQALTASIPDAGRAIVHALASLPDGLPERPALAKLLKALRGELASQPVLRKAQGSRGRRRP